MGIKKAAFIVIILLTSMFACSAVNTRVRAIGVTGTVSLGCTPLGAIYDSGKGEIWVNTYGGAATLVISDSTNKVVATIKNSVNVIGVNGIAYDSGKNEIFQSVGYTTETSVYSVVNVISDITDSVVATIPMGSFAGAMAYDSGKSEIYVATGTGISVISDANNSVIAEIPLQYSPSDLVYDSGKGEMFVTQNVGLPGNAPVTVISDGNNTVVANIYAGVEPYCLAYDSGKGEIFVTDNSGNTVAVISDATDSVVDYVNAGYYPLGIAYDSGKGEIYVGLGNYTDYGGYVSVISDTNNTVIATIPNIPYPQAIAYDSGKGELFATNSVIDWEDHVFSDTLTVISDCPNLASPTVSASQTRILQGQTAVLEVALLTTGTSPYAYQWFVEAPNATNFQPISNATSSNYNFTTTTSTAAGNWSFMLQVTDATGAAVNSTATQVTVNAPTPPTAKTVSGLGAEDMAVAAVAVILAAAVIVTLLLRKKRTEKRKTKENQT
jgi:YVTN family beta-propeller protein